MTSSTAPARTRALISSCPSLSAPYDRIHTPRFAIATPDPYKTWLALASDTIVTSVAAAIPCSRVSARIDSLASLP